MKSLGQIAVRFCDVVVLLGLLAATAVVLPWGLLALRLRRAPRRRAVLVLASDRVTGPLPPDQRAYFRALYGHSQFRTITVFFGGPVHYVGRFVAGVAAVNLDRRPAAAFQRLFPLAARLWGEVVAMAGAIGLLWRLRPACIEVLAPGNVVPRALLLSWAYPGGLVAKVMGNLDLLNHLRGHGSMLRLRGRMALLGILLDKLLYALFYRRCDLVIGYNGNNLDSAIALGADPRRARGSRVTIDMTVIDAPVRPRAEIAELPSCGRLIMVWSRLSPEKAVREAIQGALLALAHHADAHLVVIGDGPTRPLIEGDVAASGMAGRVHFLGYRNRTFLGAALRHASVALVPLGGFSLIEAALLERPTVCFDIEWHRELITPGETGMLADYPDPVDMAEKICQLLDVPEAAEAMGAAARQRALRMFNADAIAAHEAALMAGLATHFEQRGRLCR